MDETDLWILSYDVDGRDRSTASRVCHIVFGRKNRTTLDGSPASYDQPGFIHRPGVVWVGHPCSSFPATTPWSSGAVSMRWGSRRGWDDLRSSGTSSRSSAGDGGRAPAGRSESHGRLLVTAVDVSKHVDCFPVGAPELPGQQ